MTPQDLQTIASALGLLLSHGAQCRGITLDMNTVAEVSRLAVLCQKEAVETKPKEES